MPGTCLNCAAATFRSGRSGPHPKRCPTCADANRKARARKASAAFRERNPERSREQYARWYAANIEAKRVQSLEWYRANRERAAATNADWYAGNPQHSRDKRRRRRATTRGVDAERFSAQEIYERDGWLCQLCRHLVDPELSHTHRDSASLDHIIPLIRGGPHTRVNVQLAHRHCNEAKGIR